MAATLTEPTVLAAAKDTLYPDLDTSTDHYAVTETQFTKPTWGGWEIPDELRRRLVPYNTIRLADGEPDFLGVGMPAPEVLNADAATTPVAVIEAKGHNTDPSAAAVKTGINQAHGHLSEVNIGYVAAPIQSISDQARALARDLNIGVIGVESPHDATLVEPARVTGVGDFSTTIDAIRFQATTHRLTEGSFPVNHPKNYLGAEVVRFARAQHGTVVAALDEFVSWKGRSTRFTTLAPRWAQLARSVAIQYDPTQLIIEALERLYQRGINPATIDAVAREASRINQPLTVEVFFTQSRREDVLSADGEINESVLTDPTVYKSGIHFQFKYHLRHIGLLTHGGTDDKDAVLTNKWALEHSVEHDTISN